MRQALLSATALVSVVAMLPLAAQAETAAGGPVALKLGGQFYGAFSVAGQSDGLGPDGTLGTADDAPGAGRRNNGFLRSGDIYFLGQTKLDNGLKVGVTVKLHAEDCIDQIDQSYLWFENRFGQLVYGTTFGGAALAMFVGAPNPVAHLGLNTPDLLVVNQTNSFGNGTLAATPVTQIDSQTLERLTYFSPRIHGVQLGLSYTPEQCAAGNAGSMPCGGTYAGMPADNLAQGYDMLEGAVNYRGDIGPVGLQAYGGLYTSRVGDGVQAVVATPGTAGERQWGAGGSLGYAGFTLGASYMRTVDAAFTPGFDMWDWNLGLFYRTGPWSGGVQYANKRAKLAGVSDGFEGGSVGAAYALGPGLNLFGAVQVYDWTTNAASPAIQSYATNRAWSASFGTSLDF